MFSWVTAKDSLRVILNRDKAKVKASKYRDTFLPDGMLKQRLWTEKEWAKRFPKSVKRYGDLYRNAYKELDPEAQSYFERTLKLMNDQGATPLIVLTPINPKLLKVLSPLGWPQRHQQVLDYVTSLEGTYDFVFVDITDMTKFGADPVAVLRRRAHDDDQHAARHRLRAATDRRAAQVTRPAAED